MDIAIELFKADINKVKEELMSLPSMHKFQCSLIETSIEDRICDMLTPLYSPTQIQLILFSPSNNDHTTICYTNLENGWAGYFEGNSKQLDFEMFHCRICDIPYEAYFFHYVYKEYKRHVLCYQDPNWVFYQDGLPLPFEDTNLYVSKIKKKRLNREIIINYLKYNGWDIEDEKFWHSGNPIYKLTQNGRLDKTV